MASFKQFTKVDYNGHYTYMDIPFYDSDLKLIEFPAYFKLNKESKWNKYILSKNFYTDIQSDIDLYKEKIKYLEILLNDTKQEEN